MVAHATTAPHGLTEIQILKVHLLITEKILDHRTTEILEIQMSEDAHELNNTKLFLENTEFQFFFSKFQMSEWSASVSSLKIPVDVFSNFSTQSSCTTTCCTHAPPPATAWPPRD